MQSTSTPWPKQSFNFAFFFFSYYSFVGVFPPYITLFLAHRGMSAVEVGILMAMMQAMRIVGPNLWGWIADVLQRRSRVLQFTAACASLTFITLFFGGTFFQFALIMIAVNLFTSSQGPLSEAIMLSEMRGDLTHYGPLRLWGSVGYIVMTSASGMLLDQFGIELMPWIGLVILIMVLAVSMRIYDTPQVYPQHQMISISTVIKRREVIAFMISAGFMLAAHSALYAFFSLYLSELGYSSMTIGFMWSLGAIAEIIFFIYQAPILRRLGVKAVMLLSLLCAVARFAMIGVGAESLLVLILAQILHAATFGAHHSTSVMTIQRWFAGPLQARGQALFISASYGIGGTLGALFLSGIWDQFGPQTVYIVASGFAFISFVAAMISFRWQKQQEITS